jgi:hypothetical protein
VSQEHRDLCAAFREHNPLCGLSHIYRCHQQRDLDTGCFGLIIYILYNVGDRSEPCVIPWRRYFTLDVHSEFSLRKERVNKLD